jgi:hypothetical protein
LTQDKKKRIKWFTVVLAVAVRPVSPLQMKAPQLHIDEATCLIGLTNAFVGGGAFGSNKDN